MANRAKYYNMENHRYQVECNRSGKKIVKKSERPEKYWKWRRNYR